MINKVKNVIKEFFNKEKFSPKTFMSGVIEETYYNEANLQHDLALYIKENEKINDDIELRLEYPVTKLFDNNDLILSKKEIDIIIKLKNKEKDFEDEFLIVELKYVKEGDGIPLALLGSLKDILFCEQIKFINRRYKKRKLHFITILLTDKLNWTSDKHIYGTFKLRETINKPDVQFNLKESISYSNSIDTIKEGCKSIKKRIEKSKELKDFCSVGDNKIVFKEEHEIFWKKINGKWLYYINKF
tara:strand:- start:440 stop:1171 length:732 start_codon:yes stop_codon:yes gene_type:complete